MELVIGGCVVNGRGGEDYFDFFGKKLTFYMRPDGFECGLTCQTII